jgi:NADH-quinone oxidoreductase subunit G
VISGTGCGSRQVLEAAGAITRALEGRSGDPALLLVAPEVNSIGSGLLGGGLDLASALDLAGQAQSTLIVAENDLFRRFDRGHLESALAAIERVVVIDSVDTPTASQAHLVFPAATFAEAAGAVVNIETRAQRYYPAMPTTDDVAPTWRWLVRAAEAAGRNDLNWSHVDEVLDAAARRPGLERLGGAETELSGPRKVPRAPLRYSGRTAMTAQVDIHEPKTPEDLETPFSWSMEGRHPGEPSALLPFVWSPGWNSNQSVFKFQDEVGGQARGGDPGIRLLDVPAGGRYPSPSEAGAPAGTAGYRLLPLHVIFGSDELSGRSPPIAERAPAPFAVLNPADAERLAVRDGGGIRVDGLATSLEVRTDPAMSEGCAGIAVGLTGTAHLPTEPVELAADPDYRSLGGSPDVIARG